MGAKSRQYIVYQKICETTKQDILNQYPGVTERDLALSNYNDVAFNGLLFKCKNKLMPSHIKWVYQLYDDGKFVDEGTEKYLCKKYYWNVNHLCLSYKKGYKVGGYVVKRREITTEDMESGNLDRWFLE